MPIRSNTQSSIGREQHFATEPIARTKETKLNVAAVIKSGLIAGAFLLVLPQGQPWAALTFFSGAVMGRTIGTSDSSALFLSALLHMGLALIYAFPIAAIVRYFRSWRGVLVGPVVGLGLYAVNFAAFSALTAQEGGELRVAVTHAVFGLLAAGAYKAMARRGGPQQIPAPKSSSAATTGEQRRG